MRALLMSVIAVFATGCTFGFQACSNDGDCGDAGAFECSSGFCIERSGTGGGDATGGGSTGGGSTGGGIQTGGGMNTGGGNCACSAWQTCESNACANVVVSIEEPSGMAAFGAQASVAMKVKVQTSQGADYTGSTIPVQVGSQAATTLSHTTGPYFEGNVTMPATASMVEITAGWAMANDVVTVSVVKCNDTCAEWTECHPSATGGSCDDLKLTLQWVTPDAGQSVGPNRPLVLSLSATRPDGGGFGGNIPFTLDGMPGVLTGSGLKTATVTTADAEQMSTLNAGWDAGLTMHAIRMFHVDRSGPMLTLAMDGGTYQRDGVAYARVNSDETLSDAGLTLAGVAMAPVDTALCGGGAACFRLEMWTPPMNTFETSLGVEVSGVDVFGNARSFPSAHSVDVTRLRWDRQTSPVQPVQALVVGADGTVYLGTNALGAGRVYALTLDGGVGPSSSIGDVQSLAFSGSRVFAAYNATTGFIGSVRASDLAEDTTFRCPGPGLSYSGIALMDGGAGAIWAVGSINSTNGTTGGKGCVYDPSIGPTAFANNMALLDSAEIPTLVRTSNNVIIHGGTASFITKTTTGFSWQPVDMSQALPVLGTAVEFSTDPSLPASGQALVGNQFLISGVGVGNRKLFAFDGGASSDLGNSTGDKGVAAIASSTRGFVGSGTGLLRFDPSSLGSPVSVAAAVGDNYLASPVLGASRNAAGELGYAVGQNGNLVVFEQGNASASWNYDLTTAQVLTHPTFDCNRTNAESKTGILYVGTSNGHVMAIVVDSPKLLDTAGAWPKYQRTQGNAGNDDAVFPINWPACQ